MNDAKLVLFDIDGTLLLSRGAGRRAMARTLEHMLGRSEGLNGLRMDGMTDPLIFRDAMRAMGYSEAEIAALLPDIIRHYPGELARELAPSAPGPRPEPLPGVRQVLELLAERPDVVIALLTGNVEPGAWLKLHACRLDHFFTFGAFGNEGPERHKLPAVAVEKAREETGHHFAGQSIVIVGDTPHDIACGQHLGVVAVGTATGRYTPEELRAAGADVVLTGWHPPQEAVELLLGAPPSE